MATIAGAGRDTQLFMHTMASAFFAAQSSHTPVLDISAVREPSAAAQEAAVSAHLDATLADLEAVIRSRKNPPSDVSAATLGRRLVERGEVYDAVSRTYTPGPGFFTLFDALVTDARAEAKQPVQAANLPNSQENL